MWRPTERIRYTASTGNWPTAKQAENSLLFSPITVGTTNLTSRTWIPAMVPWRASDDGFVTQDVLDWYACFAKGQPGAIVVEATGIRDIPSGPLLRIGDDRYLPGLQDLVRTVREASNGETRLLIQIIDFLSIRRRPDPIKYLERFLTITDSHREFLNAPDDAAARATLATLPRDKLEQVLTPRELESLDFGHRERVTDTDHPHIHDLPQQLPKLFSAAARRANEAGFDGVELHYAHAYTMAAFLSRLNTREDGYGTTRDGRLRMPLEVLAAVRNEVGKDYTVGCRYLADECIPGGNELNDAVEIGCALAKAGMDFLSLSRGGKFDDAKQPKVGEAAYPYTGRSGYECMPSYFSDARGPFGRNLSPSAAIREAIRSRGMTTPVIVAGGIHNFDQAEAVIASGQADIVGFARQALADPDWFRKVRSGRGDAVRLCLYTNYCEALDQRHRQVTCELWDREQLDEEGVKRSSDGKRRLLPPAWKP